MNYCMPFSIMIERLARQFSVVPRGVLHIGAHLGQEALEYDQAGLKNVIWIEGNPDLFPKLTAALSDFPAQRAFLCLASDKDHEEVQFHVMSNESASSSILEPSMEIFDKWWPGIQKTKTEKLCTRRLDAFFQEAGVDLTPYNIINIDIQGNELQALQGLGRALRGFDMICSEIRIGADYQGCTLLHELDVFLLSNGFSRAYLTIDFVEGEAWYVRKEPAMGHRLISIGGARAVEWTYRTGLFHVLKKSKRTKAFVKRIFPRGISTRP